MYFKITHHRPYEPRVMANRMRRQSRDKKELDQLIEDASDPDISDLKFTRLMEKIEWVIARP